MNAAYTSRGPHNVGDVTEPPGHFPRDHVTDRARRAMEAAGAVDAKNAPTAPWKTQRAGFPQLPQAIIILAIEMRSDRKVRVCAFANAE
jgi:hypothetical protein